MEPYLELAQAITGEPDVKSNDTRWEINSFVVNRISAMVVDIRPAAGIPVSLEISWGRNRFEIGTPPFSCEAGSSPLMGLNLVFFSIIFPVNQRHIYRYFGLRQ